MTTNVEDLAARVDAVEQDASFFDNRLTDVESTMVTAHNASVCQKGLPVGYVGW